LELDFMRERFQSILSTTAESNEKISAAVHRLQGVEIARNAIFYREEIEKEIKND